MKGGINKMETIIGVNQQKRNDNITKTLEGLQKDLATCLKSYDFNGYDWRLLKCLDYWALELSELVAELKNLKANHEATK